MEISKRKIKQDETQGGKKFFQRLKQSEAVRDAQEKEVQAALAFTRQSKQDMKPSMHLIYGVFIGILICAEN